MVSCAGGLRQQRCNSDKMYGDFQGKDEGIVCKVGPVTESCDLFLAAPARAFRDLNAKEVLQGI